MNGRIKTGLLSEMFVAAPRSRPVPLTEAAPPSIASTLIKTAIASNLHDFLAILTCSSPSRYPRHAAESMRMLESGAFVRSRSGALALMFTKKPAANRVPRVPGATKHRS